MAIGVKRLHDLNITGWWIPVAYVPGVGQLLKLGVLGLLPGTIGSNRFGRDPRELFSRKVSEN